MATSLLLHRIFYTAVGARTVDFNQVRAAKMLLGSITPNQPDTNFSDAYELGKELGKGAHAQVFVAIPRSTGSGLGSGGGSSRAARNYAVKRIDRTKIGKADEKRVYEEVCFSFGGVRRCRCAG